MGHRETVVSRHRGPTYYYTRTAARFLLAAVVVALVMLR
jgi:hypothetical protein